MASSNSQFNPHEGIEQYRPFVERICYRILRNVRLEDRQDACQDVMSILAKHHAKLLQISISGGNVDGFVFRVTQRVCRRSLRAESIRLRHERTSIHDNQDIINQIVDSAPTPEELATGQCEIDRILADLPQREREVVEDHALKEMDYEQIAEAKRLSLGNVRQIYHRGIQRIGKMLSKERNENL